MNYGLEQLALKWYDQAYAFCDHIGIVKIAHRLTAKQTTDGQRACDHSIICNRAESCGRWRCPARTVTIDTYVRRLNQLATEQE